MPTREHVEKVRRCVMKEFAVEEILRRDQRDDEKGRACAAVAVTANAAGCDRGSRR
jgi:hypothetical protein